ncbi:hypothetical protein BU17DRAFT_69966 [Hysterangium stoloniferum]|nr:hypothetical protein BU17DRAFT_69966 [Hysterangium stoloniferum]
MYPAFSSCPSPSGQTKAGRPSVPPIHYPPASLFPSHPPPKPYQPPDKICDSCKNEASGSIPRWTECIDNPRKGKGQSLRGKRACASCRADNVQCEVECMSCVESSGGTHHHYQESPAEASTSSSLQDKATPTSPSSPLESPLSPYSRQSPHNHAAVCVPDPDSHNSGSQGHNPPTPTPSPSPVFSIQPSLSQLHSTSLRDRNTILHMATPTLDPQDHEESPRSPMSPLSPHSLQVPTTASLYHTTPGPVEPRSYSEGNAQRLVSLPSCYPSQRRHSGLYDPRMESDESAPILSPLRKHSHPQDEASTVSSSLSHPPQTNPTTLSSHSTTSSMDPLTHHPYYGDTFHHDLGTALGSQPLQRSLPFTSPLTRPQAVDEPRKVTLPSFAETFPEFVGSSLRVGGHVILYPG